MKVLILSHTPDPEKIVAAAARLCYSKISATQIMDNFSQEKAASFIKKLMDMGHMSPTEHVSFTFAIDGVSRTLLAQITRHRIASYSVQSLRYNNPFDKEISLQDNKDKLTAKNLSYLEGFELSCRLSGNKNNIHQQLIEKYHINGLKPDNIEEFHRPTYIRGIFDGAGLISDDPEFCVAFTSELEPIFKAVHFNTTQKGDKLLIKSENALDFGRYIYEDSDFTDSLYDEKKLLALCNKYEKLNDHILSVLLNSIDTNYYAMVPESISKNLKAILSYIKGLNACKKCYMDLVKMGINQEDARYILPHGTQTRIVMTMNVRSLYNFFNLRCCERAQTEIRQLANLMLAEVKKIAPGLFQTAGAPCEALGYCPEGDFGCGKYPTSK
jgi:thymidylate synthase (FAD)